MITLPRLAQLLIAIVLCLASQGCDSPYYGIAIRNLTGVRISEVNASMGEVQMAPGVMPSNGLAKAYPSRRKPTPTATVTWQTEDGAQHRAETAVPQPMPRSFDGTLLIKIYGDDNVQIAWVPKSEAGRVWDEP